MAGTTAMLFFVIPTVVIGFTGPHDFATNLAIDACLDSGGSYDLVAKLCVQPPR